MNVHVESVLKSGHRVIGLPFNTAPAQVSSRTNLLRWLRGAGRTPGRAELRCQYLSLKPECRMPKSESSPKSEAGTQACSDSRSSFLDFGFRNSDFPTGDNLR